MIAERHNYAVTRIKEQELVEARFNVALLWVLLWLEKHGIDYYEFAALVIADCDIGGIQKPTLHGPLQMLHVRLGTDWLNSCTYSYVVQFFHGHFRQMNKNQM